MAKRKCGKCLHTWEPKTDKPAKRCPACKSYNWRLPKVERRKYPVDVLEVGESITIKWPPALEDRPRIHLAVSQYARRSRKIFFMDGTSAGLYVKRTA